MGRRRRDRNRPLHVHLSRRVHRRAQRDARQRPRRRRAPPARVVPHRCRRRGSGGRQRPGHRRVPGHRSPGLRPWDRRACRLLGRRQPRRRADLHPQPPGPGGARTVAAGHLRERRRGRDDPGQAGRGRRERAGARRRDRPARARRRRPGRTRAPCRPGAVRPRGAVCSRASLPSRSSSSAPGSSRARAASRTCTIRSGGDVRRDQRAAR
jgi:hypothetical protein